MTLLRSVARPMLAATFIYGGADSVRHPESKAAAAQTAANVMNRTTGRQFEPVDLVRFNGAVQVVSGAALATGRTPRLAALALAASLGPTTTHGHQFWNETDPGQKRNQTIHFLKNISMAGGLLIAAADPHLKKKPARRKDETAKKRKKSRS